MRIIINQDHQYPDHIMPLIEVVKSSSESLRIIKVFLNRKDNHFDSYTAALKPREIDFQREYLFLGGGEGNALFLDYEFIDVERSCAIVETWNIYLNN